MRRALFTSLLALLVALASPPAATALKVPASDEKIILTTASGEEKVVTRAEMDAMESQQRQLHAQLLDHIEGDWVEDQSLDDVARRNPALARSIGVARESFAVLQKHGYARGYALESFTEVDAVSITSKKAQQAPDFNGKIEMRITMQLHVARDLNSGVPANTGTSGAAPEKLGYEVEVLFDKNEVTSVVYAWQLTKSDRRGKQLSISPSDALKKRYEERQLAGGSFATRYATWLLAGGVALIVAGCAVLLLTPRPPPVKQKEPAATSPKTSNGDEPRRRKDAKSVSAREAGSDWELANGK